MSVVLPGPDRDRDSAPWWDGVARHELLAQGCDACGTFRWPPRGMCNQCGSLVWSWRELSGRASVATWLVNHHAFGEASTPYVVVLARLDEQADILVPGAWAGAADGSDLSVDRALRLTFDDREGGGTLLRWAPGERGGGT